METGPSGGRQDRPRREARSPSRRRQSAQQRAGEPRHALQRLATATREGALKSCRGTRSGKRFRPRKRGLFLPSAAAFPPARVCFAKPGRGCLRRGHPAGGLRDGPRSPRPRPWTSSRRWTGSWPTPSGRSSSHAGRSATTKQGHAAWPPWETARRARTRTNCRRACVRICSRSGCRCRARRTTGKRHDAAGSGVHGRPTSAAPGSGSSQATR